MLRTSCFALSVVWAKNNAQGRKEEAEETLRRAELKFEGDLGLAADAVADFALHKIDEIEAFKTRLDLRFAEKRTSVLKAATYGTRAMPPTRHQHRNKVCTFILKGAWSSPRR